jgi:hypothetical protein
MTIYAKTEPVGIDKAILKWQNRLENCFGDTIDIDVYGRLYITERKDNKKVAEAYVSEKEYRDVFLDDRKSAIFGFLVNENRTGFSLTKCNVELICSCNLEKIYGSDLRNDEETILTVLQIIQHYSLRPNQKQIKTGLANVFNGVSIDKFKFRDMQPWFNFSISFDLVY